VGITTEGIEAERQARLWLRNKGFTNYQQLDWLFKVKNQYCCIECKSRELYKPPPFTGTGLDIKQINLRKQLYDDLKIDTVILVFEKNTNNVYWQWLRILEQGEYIDTKNGIRIYNINNYHKE